MLEPPSPQVVKGPVDVALRDMLGSVRFTAGRDDLKGLFQPKGFYDPTSLTRMNCLKIKMRR